MTKYGWRAFWTYRSVQLKRSSELFLNQQTLSSTSRRRTRHFHISFQHTERVQVFLQLPRYNKFPTYYLFTYFKKRSIKNVWYGEKELQQTLVRWWRSSGTDELFGFWRPTGQDQGRYKVKCLSELWDGPIRHPRRPLGVEVSCTYYNSCLFSDPVCEVVEPAGKGQSVTLTCRMTYDWQAPARQFNAPPKLDVSLSWIGRYTGDS